MSGSRPRNVGKVVFYTRLAYMDSAVGLLKALSDRVEVHLILELPPEGRMGPLGGIESDLPLGVVAGNLDWTLPAVRERLEGLASFHFAVFTSARAFHPSNVVVCLKLARLLRKIGPDVVHFDDVTSRGLALLYLGPRARVVLSIHDPQARVGEPLRRVQAVRRRFIRRASALLFRSRYAAETLAASAPETERKARAAVPLGVFDVFADGCPPRAEQPRTVLFFGQISHYKGIDTLTAAAPAVAQRVRGLRVVIAGRPGAGYEFRHPPPLPNEGEWDVVLGHVSVERLCELFREAALVVVPYVEASQSGVISTAFAFHTPVVGSAVGGIPEVVEDGVEGALFEPGDAEGLARRLTELLSDADARAAMRARIAEKQRGELSWDRLAEMTLDVYE
ncbi:MAG: glycosyltransferase family 4 protein [Actinomycetota bacterium]|nr:glycosyltransferase family 4 protein [Actinomycetota bacterium]